MVVSEENGDGVITAKRGVDAIFDDRYYSKLFPMRAKIPYRFAKMYAAYRLYEMLSELGYAKAKDYRRQRHAFWNSVWLLHRGVTSNGVASLSFEISSLKRGFDLIPKKGRTRKIIRALTKAVWHAWRLGRKKDPELYTPNNFFKAKYGNHQILALTYPRVYKELHSLGRDLVKAASTPLR
jgi:hypothetical protein